MGFINLLRTVRDFRRNRHGTREQLLARQLARFRALVAYAAKRSPYYQALIRERQIDIAACVPADFPVLTKADYVRHFDDIVTDRSISTARISRFLTHSTRPDDLFDGKYLVVHTSGTSGTLAYYLFTLNEWERGHVHYLRFSTPRFRQRTAHVAAMNGHFHGAIMTCRAERGINRLLFKIRRFDVNNPTRQIIDGLNEFQPRTVSGYGRALKILAHFQRNGELRIRPKHLFYGGEPLSREERDDIARVFDVPVISVYACSEHLMMGASDPTTGNMMLFEDDLIFEFGEEKLGVTNLFNYTVPLIRYQMNDVITPLDEAGHGHPFTMAKDLVGRTEEMLVLKNRHGTPDFIHPIVIAEFYVEYLRAFQIVVVDDTHFVFKVMLDAALSTTQREETLGHIQRRLRQFLVQKEFDNVYFEVEPVEQLGADPKTGKFRLILRPTAPPAKAESTPLLGELNSLSSVSPVATSS